MPYEATCLGSWLGFFPVGCTQAEWAANIFEAVVVCLDLYMGGLHGLRDCVLLALVGGLAIHSHTKGSKHSCSSIHSS